MTLQLAQISLILDIKDQHGSAIKQVFVVNYDQLISETVGEIKPSTVSGYLDYVDKIRSKIDIKDVSIDVNNIMWVSNDCFDDIQDIAELATNNDAELVICYDQTN